MKVTYNKEEVREDEPVAFLTEGGLLGFQEESTGNAIFLWTTGKAWNSKRLDFRDECRLAAKVFYPGDKITIEF